MSCSFVILKELRRQAEILKEKSIYLKYCSSELKTVMRSLEEMQSLQESFQNLSQTKQKLTNQSRVLQTMILALYDIADRYEVCEKKNIQKLDGHTWDGSLYYGLFSMNALREETIEKRSQATESETVPLKIGIQKMVAESIISKLTKP